MDQQAAPIIKEWQAAIERVAEQRNAPNPPADGSDTLTQQASLGLIFLTMLACQASRAQQKKA
jgi:hypothetical protein